MDRQDHERRKEEEKIHSLYFLSVSQTYGGTHLAANLPRAS